MGITEIATRAHRHIRAQSVLFFALSLGSLSGQAAVQVPYSAATPKDLRGGLLFDCNSSQIAGIRNEMLAYLKTLAIDPAWLSIQQSPHGIQYALNTPLTDTNTLNLKERSQYKIKRDSVSIKGKGTSLKQVKTVSKKEIVLALLQHGRLTVFKNNACTLQALKDNVAVRQNIVTWTQKLNWNWPDGGAAQWNSVYWRKGTPLAQVPLTVALTDAFTNQNKYALGCYAATKLVMAQGILDFYSRIKRNTTQAQIVTSRLELDRDPLVGVEPARMWSFEANFDKSTYAMPGKLLTLIGGVAPDNFVPGDWAYIVNTDAVSSQKTGYEGSNAVYLGGGLFDDYFNDNNHSYTYDQKLDEVYQWRNHVFSRSRDAAKIKKLSSTAALKLRQSPTDGGLVLPIRATPYLFGYEPLPPLNLPVTVATLISKD